MQFESAIHVEGWNMKCRSRGGENTSLSNEQKGKKKTMDRAETAGPRNLGWPQFSRRRCRNDRRGDAIKSKRGERGGSPTGRKFSNVIENERIRCFGEESRFLSHVWHLQARHVIPQRAPGNAMRYLRKCNRKYCWYLRRGNGLLRHVLR